MAAVSCGSSGLRCSWRGRPGQDHIGPGKEFAFCSQSTVNPLKDFQQRGDISDLHFKKLTWLSGK